MESLLKSHSKFLNRLYRASLIFPNSFTILPTFIFLIFTFVFLYQQNCRRVTVFTKWKRRIFQNIKMHWLYFNICRIWFILMSACRKIINSTNKFIEENIEEEKQLYNQYVLNTMATIIMSLFSLLPILLIYINISDQPNFPNLLMWVLEDPWLHHEIGMSGRCLQLPNNLNLVQLKNPPYRIRRSMSDYDLNQSNISKKSLRTTQSMIELHALKSIDDLL